MKQNCCGGHAHTHPVSSAPADNQVAIDPVCGMKVKLAGAKHMAVHGGRTYYFCSSKCLAKFTAEPDRYLQQQEANEPETPPGTIYTCPMHPEIRQVGPGSCPICGMALEPELVTADAAPNAELADMRRRFWVGLVLSLPVLALEMGGHLTNLHMVLGAQLSNWVQFALATPVVLWAGMPFFERAWQSLRTRNLNMFTLIAMGTGVAWLYSVVAIMAPGLFPSAFRGAEGTVAVYFEAAAVITVLVLLGQVLELRARDQTSGAIRALLDLAPKTARRIADDGSEEEVSLDSIVVGDRLRVRPGEKVPVDGEVVEGRSSLDESMVTGESMPVTKERGAKLIGGTLNTTGSLVMCAEKVGRDTMLARIVQMVAAGPALAGAHPAPGRSGLRLLSCRPSSQSPIVAFAAWAIWGPRATPGVRARGSGHRAHHRLPVRARSRHADVDHGGRRPRRPGGCADQECRSAGTHGTCRHACGRQDRHADRRQAHPGVDRPGGRLRRGRRSCGSLPRSKPPASIRWRSPSSMPRASRRGIALAAGV